MFRCNNRELEAVGEENINSFATNPSCDCETFHNIDISLQPTRNEIELGITAGEKETCKLPSPEIYAEEEFHLEENECENKVKFAHEIVS